MPTAFLSKKFIGACIKDENTLLWRLTEARMEITKKVTVRTIDMRKRTPTIQLQIKQV